jgi:hypothetical protein
MERLADHCGNMARATPHRHAALRVVGSNNDDQSALSAGKLELAAKSFPVKNVIVNKHHNLTMKRLSIPIWDKDSTIPPPFEMRFYS